MIHDYLRKINYYETDKMSMISVVADSKVKDGINNAYVEMRIFLEVTARIVLPFASEKVVISNVIPLSMNIVQGSIPEAYISSFK